MSIGKHTGLELRDQGCVPRQNSKLAAQSGNDDRVDGFGKHSSFWCYDF